jgi:hypothetical protein
MSATIFYALTYCAMHTVQTVACMMHVCIYMNVCMYLLMNVCIMYVSTYSCMNAILYTRAPEQTLRAIPLNVPGNSCLQKPA